MLLRRADKLLGAEYQPSARSSGDSSNDDLTKSMMKGLKSAKPELRIKFTFPGKVLKSNGKISGNSVTWTPELGKNLTMTAEAKAS